MVFFRLGRQRQGSARHRHRQRLSHPRRRLRRRHRIPSASLAPGEDPTTSGPEANGWLVAVNLSNSGYAAAEIPVTVSNADTSVTQRVLVPARGKATQRILIQGRPTQVQANDGTIPETEASIHIKTLTDAPGSSSSSSSQPTGVEQKPGTA